MTELLTSDQMRRIEQAAMASGAVTGLQLMERAGQGVVTEVFKWRPELAVGVHRASILCGPGNNGGDGYVIARALEERGWDVEVFALAPPKTPDAQAMARAWGGTARALSEESFRASADADLYVDAIFGTGLSRAPEGDLASLLAHLGGSGGDYAHFHPRLVAVDAPTGLCLDSGRQLAGGTSDSGESSVPLAGLTVTFECPKLGHFLADGPAACGQLAVVDLALSTWRGTDPKEGYVRPARISIVDRKVWAAPCANDALASRISIPKWQGHKFDNGDVLVVTGGLGATGAARLAARAALRVGAGLVTLAAPRAAIPECAAQITSIMLKPCDDPAELTALLADKRRRAVCIGPGLGLDDRAAALVAAVLDSGTAAVLDADALTLIARDAALQEKLHKDCILTPHMGEFRRLAPDLADALLHPRALAARDRPKTYADRLKAEKSMGQFRETAQAALTGPATSKVDVAREAAARLGCGIVLKGPDTVFAPNIGPVFVHAAVYDRSVPWLATAGAGDVLAGLIAGQVAKAPGADLSMVPPAIWLHAEAARLFGPGLIAEDLPDMIPAVLRNMQEAGARS
ncbi:NAD(P)H-hydrate epimerase [Primorskyibacter sp. S187A]|uniref:NAD(P)H-hydrate epimerase n=1 Tax=Primorskyibacter sp. S187A TaxID=3415130 RepID=UPI003C7E6241